MTDIHVDTPTAELVPVAADTGTRAEQMPPEEDPASPKVGRWYWVVEPSKKVTEKTYKVSVRILGADGIDDDPDPVDLPEERTDRWFGCVTHIGSNYIQLKGPFGREARIHGEDFDRSCLFEENPQRVIAENVGKHEMEVRELMGQVKQIMARLAVTNGPTLPSSTEAGALAIYEGKTMDGYKRSLILAKEKTVPDLFKEIKGANARLAKWLCAEIIPMEAQADAMEPAIDRIKDRIFSVELYAGLVEKVQQITDGEPAELLEKIHIFQRRYYMDEECLAYYECGGMDFKSLKAFDQWLAKPVNLNRILPFPKCVAAFQVRRTRKYREVIDLQDFFRIRDEEKLDKKTFLYIRNGDRLYRLGTEIEFGKKLFPDLDNQKYTGKLYSYAHSDGSVEDVITENQWLGMQENERENERKEKVRYDAWKAAQEAKPEGERESNWWMHEDHRFNAKSHRYKAYDRNNVYYDDISKYIQDEMTRHNRLVLVLQGLLDRSPILHPHPQWHLWTDGGFQEGLELVYDDSRALRAGPAPDFRAYQQALNAQLKPGDVTYGQHDSWLRYEAAKESERRASDWRYHGDRSWNRTHFQPDGNPGPGKLARVVRVDLKRGVATYQWLRDRKAEVTPRGASDQIGCTFTTKLQNVLNVSAYRSGDFMPFFADPATRANYLQWAPFLLEAEEYHAGNRKVRETPVAVPKRVRTAGGSYEYQQRTKRQRLVGKAVRLARDLTRGDKMVLKKGTLFRVTHLDRALFIIDGIQADGTPDTVDTVQVNGKKQHRYCGGVPMYDLIEDPTIPPDPKMEAKKAAERKARLERAAKERAALAAEADIPERSVEEDEDE